MSSPTILEEKPISMAELKIELTKIKKRDGELNFRAEKTEDYLNRFVKLTKKSSEELTKKLEELEIPRVKDIHIKKFVDLLPAKVEEVKLILEGYPITVNNENCKKIAKLVSEYR